jgi:hypothetical protein
VAFVKISELPAASSAAGTDELEANQSGTSRKVTAAQIRAGLAGSGANSDITALSGLTTALSVAQGGTGATNAGTARTNLGLGSVATQPANNVAITGGSVTGITDLAIADGGTGASTAADARTNLGVAYATNTQTYAGDTATVLTPERIYAASAPVALTDGATITPNFQAGRVFSVMLAGNRTLANPTNQVAGQSGIIIVSQDGSGSRTLSYGSAWDFPGGAPTLTTTANAKDVISYYVQASGVILCTISRAFS